MTVARIYALIWIFILGVTAVMYLSGLFNPITLAVFGFVISTLAFMGVVAVLPVFLDSHYAPKTHPAYQASTRKGFV